jgi:hypothetical protein
MDVLTVQGYFDFAGLTTGVWCDFPQAFCPAGVADLEVADST